MGIKENRIAQERLVRIPRDNSPLGRSIERPGATILPQKNNRYGEDEKKEAKFLQLQMKKKIEY